MPTGDNDISDIIMLDPNGNPLGKVVDAETLTMSVTDDESTPLYLPKSMSFSCKWEMEKTNRKKFCRELVKLGFTKAEAKAVARKIPGNYSQHLATIRLCGKEYVKMKLRGESKC